MEITGLYTFEEISKSVTSGHRMIESWDAGRLGNFPIWTEFVTFVHCPDCWFYTHHNPSQHCFEIPLHGELQITHGDRRLVLKPGEIYLLPSGEYNRLETVGQNYCSKWSIGICGSQLNTLLPSLFHEHRRFSVGNSAVFVGILKELMRLLHDRKDSDVSRIAGLTMQFLMELAQRVSARIPPSLGEAVRIFEFNIGRKPSLRQVAEELHISEFRLATLFKQYFGVTPKQYRINLRLKQAEQLLLKSSLSIKEVALRLDYGAPQFLTREFRKKYGCSPREFRQRKATDS